MVKDAIAKGATIEEAQQAAILALNAPVEADIQFEVLTFPEKKKFGLFGGKLAEVRAFYEAKEEKPKVAPAKKSTPAKKAPQKAEKKQDAAPKKNAAEKKTSEKKEQNAAKAPAKKDAGSEAKGQQPKKKEEQPREAVVLEEAPEQVKRAYAYLETILKGLGIESYDIDLSKSEKEYFFEVTSEDNYSLLIGRRGETLDSIQYLTRLAANRGKEDGKSVRISINVGDYREKRERTLKDIARKNARRVRKYGRNVTLNPMNPSERRIIHTTVADIEGVQSYSVGSESERRVVIALEEGVEPLQRNNRNNNRNRNGRNDRYNNNRNGGRNDRNRNNNRGSRNGSSASADAAPARAPRSDSAGSRYGKIAPKFDAAEIKAKAAEAAAAEAEAEAVSAEAVAAEAEASVAAAEVAEVEAAVEAFDAADAAVGAAPAVETVEVEETIVSETPAGDTVVEKIDVVETSEAE